MWPPSFFCSVPCCRTSRIRGLTEMPVKPLSRCDGTQPSDQKRLAPMLPMPPPTLRPPKEPKR